eukprot:scaffold172205_cov33-Tisochrysis_lutea.AAC.1
MARKRGQRTVSDKIDIACTATGLLGSSGKAGFWDWQNSSSAGGLFQDFFIQRYRPDTEGISTTPQHVEWALQDREIEAVNS